LHLPLVGLLTAVGSFLATDTALAAAAAPSQEITAWVEGIASSPLSTLALLAFIAAFTLISEDLACIGAGLLAARGIISTPEAVLAAAVGIYLGDLLLYLSGYLLGAAALQKAPLRWLISEQRVKQSRALFERRGMALIFASRFIPGTRTATFIAAGIVRAKFTRLALVFAAAVMLWTPLLVVSAQLIGEQIIDYVDLYSQNALWIFVVVLLCLTLLVKTLRPLLSWRGRRVLLGRWRRIVRWEFWPYYVINSVIFFYVLFLGFCRYRQPTLFTLANPAIFPDSGFIGEKKSTIMAGLPPESLGKWRLIDGTLSCEEKQLAISTFITEERLTYPVVLKPDTGQRGQGVKICRSDRHVEEWLAKHDDDFLVMEFLPGEEFGVFYYRYPEASSGQIMGITIKRQPEVTGDGESTLEELILGDERAVCMAEVYCKALGEQLLTIPEKGEKILLVEVGAHALGTIFLDGRELNSPHLLRAIEEFVPSYRGYYFGRFDLKAPSAEHLQQGKDLKIIEFNGVTSEASYIYDPRHSIFFAWRTLMNQWRIAFAIGRQNHARGLEPMGLLAFLRHWVTGGRCLKTSSRPKAPG
jgi:membrane protein DedA with SNARE-associated domain